MDDRPRCDGSTTGYGMPRRWLPRAPYDIRPRDWAVALVIALAVFGWVDVRRRGTVSAARPEVHQTDFTVYTEAGRAFFDGRDPYRVTNPRGWFYLYPPLFAIVVSPLARLAPQAQVLVWYAASVLIAFGCGSESIRLWRALIRPDADRAGLGPWVATCAAVAVALPSLDCLQRGQVGIAILYALLLGLRLCLLGTGPWARILGGVVLALPAAVKLLPALPVAMLLAQFAAATLARGARRDARSRAGFAGLGVAAGGLAFVLVIPASLVGWDANLRHLQTWSAKVATSQDAGKASGFHTETTRNQSLSNAVFLLSDRLRGTAREDHSTNTRRWVSDREQSQRRRADWLTPRISWTVRIAVLIFLAGAGLASGLREDRCGMAAGFGLACVATLVISPLAWGHYFMLLLPAVVLVSAHFANGGRTRLAKVSAAVPAVLCVIHYVAMPWVGRVGLLGLGTAAWLLVVGSVVVACRVRLASDVAGRGDCKYLNAPHFAGDAAAVNARKSTT